VTPLAFISWMARSRSPGASSHPPAPVLAEGVGLLQDDVPEPGLLLELAPGGVLQALFDREVGQGRAPFLAIAVVPRGGPNPQLRLTLRGCIANGPSAPLLVAPR
jgi:hypothetical protein